jgi:hypothetical protein
MKIYISILSLLWFTTGNLCVHLEASEPCYDLVICAVFKNEAFYLQEWLDYHKKMGVEHFYLYDNNSEDGSREILHSYIERGDVDLYEWPVDTRSQQEYLQLLQLPAYNHALQIVKETARWAAFIDIDEFIVPVKHANVAQLLQEYEDYGGLAINWQIFGTSGLQQLPPDKRLIEMLTWKGEEKSEMNMLVKLIVQPSYVSRIEDPHSFQFEEGYFAVNGDKTAVNPFTRYHPVCISTIQINHYWFGTEDWFRTSKIPRRALWGIQISEENIQEMIGNFNVIKDESILNVYRVYHAKTI